jgi:hypothetical protein
VLAELRQGEADRGEVVGWSVGRLVGGSAHLLPLVGRGIVEGEIGGHRAR